MRRFYLTLILHSLRRRDTALTPQQSTINLTLCYYLCTNVKVNLLKIIYINIGTRYGSVKPLSNATSRQPQWFDRLTTLAQFLYVAKYWQVVQSILIIADSVGTSS